MKIYTLKNIPLSVKNRILNRNQPGQTNLIPVVTRLINDVKKNGDQALFKYTYQYDLAKLKSLLISPQEFINAAKFATPDFLRAIKQASENISKVCRSQIPKNTKPLQTSSGIKVWKKWLPIERIGLYIPGGKATYPSTLLMTVIPAQIAGCKDIIMVTPPKPDGSISPYILNTAYQLGIKKIYKVGGAQAIAALAYGTRTIPKVDKIFGPGNSYVNTAKLAVSNIVGIDLPAGPSEAMIIADDSANPVWIAADLITDAEHGFDSASVFLTTSAKLCRQVCREIEIQTKSLETAKYISSSFVKNGLFAVTDTITEAVDFANLYAPEHLLLFINNPSIYLNKVKNAGSVFVGQYTCKSSGDYATGANHVLPTSQASKYSSPLGVEAFGKWIEFQSCTKLGLSRVQKTVETLSIIEGLPAHFNSISKRFEI